MRKVRSDAKVIDDYTITGRQAPEIYFSAADLWTDANKRVETEFKILKEDLAIEFRKLFGI